MAEILNEIEEDVKEVDLEELELEEDDEMSEDDMVEAFGPVPEDAPVVPQTHGWEESV